MTYEINDAIQIIGQLEYERRLLQGQVLRLSLLVAEQEAQIEQLTAPTQEGGEDHEDILIAQSVRRA